MYKRQLLDRITNAFFSEAKLYTLDSYYVKTKDEIKKTLDELKEDVANGNLDPYNYGTDDDGNYVYDIYEDIETWAVSYTHLFQGKRKCRARSFFMSENYRTARFPTED